MARDYISWVYQFVGRAQGPGNHVRATDEWFELSTISTGEGEEDLIETANLLKMGVTDRTTVEKGALPTCRYYKIKKSETSVQIADGARDVGAPLNDLVAIVRGASRFVFCYSTSGRYIAMSLKINGAILVLRYSERPSA